MAYYIKTLKLIKHCTYCSSYERIAAVCGAMVARCKGFVCHPLCHEKGTNRHATAECLRTGHDIRLHIIVLPCEHLATSAHAALYLVKDKKNILFIAESSHSLDKLLLCRVNTALTLNSFHNNGAGFVCHLSLNAL